MNIFSPDFDDKLFLLKRYWFSYEWTLHIPLKEKSIHFWRVRKEENGVEFLRSPQFPTVTFDRGVWNVVAVGYDCTLEEIQGLYSLVEKVMKDMHSPGGIDLGDVENFLLKFKGFDINTRFCCYNSEIGTLLHWAVKYFSPNLISFLLKQGINTNIPFRSNQKDNGKTAFEMAHILGRSVCVEAFEEFKNKDKEIEELKNRINYLALENSRLKTQNQEKELEFSNYQNQITSLNETIFNLKSAQGLYPLIYLDPTQETLENTIEGCLSLIFDNWDQGASFQFDGSIQKCRDKLTYDQNFQSQFQDFEEVELLTIYLYTIKITNQYSIYVNLNKALTSPERSEKSLQKWKNYIYHFLNGLKKLPPISKSITCYRGLTVNVIDMNKAKYQLGNRITFYSFISTSESREKAMKFVEGSGTLFIIRNSLSGRSISSISAFREEREVLFPPGATFKITKIQKIRNLTEIEIEQLPTIEKGFQFLEES